MADAQSIGHKDHVRRCAFKWHAESLWG